MIKYVVEPMHGSKTRALWECKLELCNFKNQDPP